MHEAARLSLFSQNPGDKGMWHDADGALGAVLRDGRHVFVTLKRIQAPSTPRDSKIRHNWRLPSSLTDHTGRVIIHSISWDICRITFTTLRILEFKWDSQYAL